MQHARPALGRATLVAAAILAGSLWAASPAAAQTALPGYDETIADITATYGFVPTFVKRIPAAQLPAAWQQVKALEIADTTIPAKYKALIAVAVASQIPCQYCTWLDTNSAYLAGATDDEIAEAAMIAGITRMWSAFFYGTQADMDTLHGEFAPMAEAAQAARMKASN